jgi:hypothetical protein
MTGIDNCMMRGLPRVCWINPNDDENARMVGTPERTESKLAEPALGT